MQTASPYTPASRISPTSSPAYHDDATRYDDATERDDDARPVWRPRRRSYGESAG